jgi:hypothetical protein
LTLQRVTRIMFRPGFPFAVRGVVRGLNIGSIAGRRRYS